MRRSEFLASSLGSLIALFPDSLEQIERRTGGRLGVVAVDTGSGRSIKTGLGGRHNGFGDSDTRNDVAFAVPPGRAPIVVAAEFATA